jgi:hypothetical protein
VEAVRDGGRVRHDVVARLGEASALRASGELDRIVAALASHAQRSWCDESAIDVTEARAAGAVAAVATYWSRLGLDRHFAAMAGGHDAPIADAVFAMVANRLCAPRSKRALPEWVSGDVVMPAGFQVPAAHHYYRALDVVAEAKEATEAHLYGALENDDPSWPHRDGLNWPHLLVQRSLTSNAVSDGSIGVGRRVQAMGGSGPDRSRAAGPRVAKRCQALARVTPRKSAISAQE